VIADVDHVLVGRDRESQASVRRRWEALHGRIGISTYPIGHRSPAEAATILARIAEGKPD
jgi:hypothetical protein